MRWVVLAVVVAWVAVVTLPLRWLRGPAHARWDWKTELSTGVFRRAVKAVAHDFAWVRRLTDVGDMTPWMRSRVSLGEGMVHVYQGFGFVVPEARAAVRRLGAFVRGLKETDAEHV